MNTYVSNRYTAKEHAGLVSLLACVGGTVIAGLMAIIFGRGYRGFAWLTTPPATPPDLMIMIATPVMYALLGFALHRILIQKSHSRETLIFKRISIMLWFAALILNISWIPLFFTTKLFAFTFVWLTLNMSILVTLTIINFNIDRPAAIALIPCAAWLAYLCYVNLFIAILN